MESLFIIGHDRHPQGYPQNLVVSEGGPIVHFNQASHTLKVYGEERMRHASGNNCTLKTKDMGHLVISPQAELYYLPSEIHSHE